MRFPTRPWVEKRLAAFRELLERRTEASALVLRRLLGRMVLKPVYPEQGKPYYVARTAIDVLVLLEPPGSDPSSDPGANSFGWWRRSVLQVSPTQDLAKPGVGAPACAVGAVHGGDSGMMISLAVGLGAVEDTAGEIEVPTETGQEVAVGAAIPLTELAASG